MMKLLYTHTSASKKLEIFNRVGTIADHKTTETSWSSAQHEITIKIFISLLYQREMQSRDLYHESH